eukprot:4017349-Amphidinium_carterae.1
MILILSPRFQGERCLWVLAMPAIYAQRRHSISDDLAQLQTGTTLQCIAISSECKPKKQSTNIHIAQHATNKKEDKLPRDMISSTMLYQECFCTTTGPKIHSAYTIIKR